MLKGRYYALAKTVDADRAAELFRQKYGRDPEIVHESVVWLVGPVDVNNCLHNENETHESQIGEQLVLLEA